MQPTAFLPITLLAALWVAGAAFAVDASTPEGSAIVRWQESPETVFDASEIDLAALKWIARPVVVFADSPEDPAFKKQLQLLQARSEELSERDVILITDTDPSAGTALRQRLRPRGFMLVLIGKDGGIKLRKPFPWDVRELTRSIDKIPLREQEIRDKLNAGE